MLALAEKPRHGVDSRNDGLHAAIVDAKRLDLAHGESHRLAAGPHRVQKLGRITDAIRSLVERHRDDPCSGVAGPHGVLIVHILFSLGQAVSAAGGSNSGRHKDRPRLRN